jgi:hypothetical protein
VKLLALLAVIVLAPSVAASSKNARWEWATELPAEAASEVSPHNRDPGMLRDFFDSAGSGEISVVALVAHFGRPDGFSPQWFGQPIRDARRNKNESGTLRFILNDGSSLCAWTPNRKNVTTTLRYLKDGHIQLIYK